MKAFVDNVSHQRLRNFKYHNIRRIQWGKFSKNPFPIVGAPAWMGRPRTLAEGVEERGGERWAGNWEPGPQALASSPGPLHQLVLESRMELLLL